MRASEVERSQQDFIAFLKIAQLIKGYRLFGKSLVFRGRRDVRPLELMGLHLIIPRELKVLALILKPCQHVQAGMFK